MFGLLLPRYGFHGLNYESRRPVRCLTVGYGCRYAISVYNQRTTDY